jgi:hypothetical protein
MIDRMNSVIDSSKEEEIDTEEMIQVLEDLDTKGVYIH